MEVKFRISVLAAFLVASAAGLSTPGFAQEEQGDGKKQERIVVIERHEGDSKKHADAGRRTRVMSLDGEHRLRDCSAKGGEPTEFTSDGDGKKKVKILICGKDGELSGAQRAERLEQALARIQSNEHLSAEAKERIGQSLREAIERTRQTN